MNQTILISNIESDYTLNNIPSEVDLYAEEKTETINIDGINYTYNYFYDEDGNRAITILNESTGIGDIVTYEIESSNVYLNDEVVAMFGFNAQQNLYNDLESHLPQTFSNDNWIYWGSSSNRITWGQGTDVAVLAAIIASGISSLGATIGASSVIGVMGAGTLGVIAGCAIGGTVYTTTYKFNSIFVNQIRIDWSFTASTGDSYGTYMHLTSIY